MPYRDQPLLIFGPDGELFDRRRDGALFIGRVDHADKRRRRPFEGISQVRSFARLRVLPTPSA
jgi:hypothetical protein